MSLSVYLTKPVKETRNCPSCEHAWEETVRTEEVFEANITHNLGPMASHAGIYEHLWRPEELGFTVARQLIKPLRKGLDVLNSDPIYFRKYDAPNGWGTYSNLVRFVEEYLRACEEFPDASVSADR